MYSAGEVKHAYSRYIINNYSIISFERRWIKMSGLRVQGEGSRLIKKLVLNIQMQQTRYTGADGEKVVRVVELISNGDLYYVLFLLNRKYFSRSSSFSIQRQIFISLKYKSTFLTLTFYLNIIACNNFTS